MTNPASNSIFAGISFPPRKGPGYGFFHVASDIELLKNSIYVILNTRKGSMPMNYEFGSSAHDLLFEPVNDITQGLIADMIVADIEMWEPRVSVLSIKASSWENTRMFDIILKVKATGQQFGTMESFTS